MEKKLTKIKKLLLEDTPLNDVDAVLIIKKIGEKHKHLPVMGTGSCTLCDCPGFIPSSGGLTCENTNSAGGTCNHYETEHN